MLDIPVAAINEHSPYLVTLEEQNSFLFRTQYGLIYNVGFSQDTLLPSIENVYHFYIVNKDDSHFRYDPLLFKTIEAIIMAFFEQEPNVLLYFCDTLDGRQSFRNRLFKSWFDRYPGKEHYTLVNKSITYDDVSYFGAIILRKSHPDHDLIVRQFITYVDDLAGKI